MANSQCQPRLIKVPNNIQELEGKEVPANVDPLHYYYHMMQHNPQKYQTHTHQPVQSLDMYSAHSTNTIDSATEKTRQPIEHSTIQSPYHQSSQVDSVCDNLNSVNIGRRVGHSSQYASAVDDDLVSTEMSFEVGHSINTETSSVSSYDFQRSSFSEDDNLGLQPSMTGIKAPVPVRSHSNSSQGSYDSTLSFRTQDYEETDNSRNAATKKTNEQPQNGNTGSTQNGNTGSTQPYDDHHKMMRGGQSAGTGIQMQRLASNTSSSGTSKVLRMINQQQNYLNQNAPEIFISYAQEQQMPEFRRLVLQLAKTLLNNGISVSLDMLERNHMSMSFNTWLDDNLLKSTFVVVCISPNYKNEIIAPDQHQQHSVHTKYIFSRLQTEYIQNSSLNYRVIPVIMAGATQADVPSLWQDTQAYHWPEEYELIIYRIFRKEKYVKPKMGPAPICTVVTNGDDEQPDYCKSSVSSADSAK